MNNKKFKPKNYTGSSKLHFKKSSKIMKRITVRHKINQYDNKLVRPINSFNKLPVFLKIRSYYNKMPKYSLKFLSP